MKKISIILLSFILFLTHLPYANAATSWNEAVVTYGAALETDDNLRNQVANALNVENSDVVTYVYSQDVQNYVGVSFDNAALYSSIRIIKQNEGHGLNITIDESLGRITKITEEMYQNALITAGVTDADVTIIAPHDVTGDSALSGIYKAYEAQGETIDAEHTENAQQELDTISSISEENNNLEGFSQEQLNIMITEIKVQIIERGGNLSEDEIREIVNDQMRQNGLDGVLTENQVNRIINVLVNIQNSGIFQSDEAQRLLDSSRDLIDQISSNENFQNAVDSARDLGNDVKESNVFQRFLEAIKDFFQSIINFFR